MLKSNGKTQNAVRLLCGICVICVFILFFEGCSNGFGLSKKANAGIVDDISIYSEKTEFSEENNLKVNGVGAAVNGADVKEEGKTEIAKEDVAEEEADDGIPDLIKEAGFDMIYPNFRKETGRQDPFVEVNLSVPPLEVIRRMTPDKFRVIGTAITPSGQIAMIEIGDQTKIVREGDVLENEAVIKSIDQYDVVLEKDQKQLRLTMFTRKRIAKLPEEAQYPKVPGLNINDLYKQYLDKKFGEEVEGEEGETQRPQSFSDYLENREKEDWNRSREQEE